MANTISDELNRLIQAKAGIKSALEEKGLTIGDSSTLDEYPGLIQEMETGGGSSQDTSVLIDLIQRNITSIDIPYGITQIGDHAFRGCTNLIDVSIPNTVEHIYNSAFEGSGLRSINLPPSVRFLGGSCLKNTKIQHLYIPNTISQTYGNFNTALDVFSYNSSLISVTFQEPADFTQIPSGMCQQCPKLRTVNIPQTVTKIWQYAFRNCYELSKIVIPESVIEIGNNAFYDVSFGMSMAMLPTTPPTLSQTGNNIFGGMGYNWPIYVKASAENTYKNAGGNWDNVSTRIQPLAAMDYDSSTMTVTASGRDNVELYVDSSLIDSSVYTFTPGTEDSSHVVTVKSVDPSLGVLDEVSQEILIEGEEIDYSTQYFGISALADSSIGINTLKTDGELLYSEDQENWTQWDYANETLDLLTGETLYFKGNNGGHPCVWDKPLFNITGSVNLHGNISSILWGDDYLTNNTIGDGGMAYAFKNSPAIINCKNLIMAPTYNACYEACFYNCTNLITAPQLPSLSPAQRAYNNMFYGCTSLTKAPDLPALNYSANCYNYMFNGCTNLNYINAMFTNAPSALGTSNWVKNVSSTGTFVMNAAATWDPEDYRGTSGIPAGWTVEKVTA